MFTYILSKNVQKCLIKKKNRNDQVMLSEVFNHHTHTAVTLILIKTQEDTSTVYGFFPFLVLIFTEIAQTRLLNEVSACTYVQ